MSNTVLWGTGIAPAETTLRRRATSTGNLRKTSVDDQRVAYLAPVSVKYLRKTSVGDQRVTSVGDRRIVIEGTAGPAYYQTVDVPNDGGEAFSLLFQSNPWQPDAQGGECVFRWLYLSVAWSLEATIRVTPTVDGKEITETLPDSGIIRTVRPVFVLAQQDGTLQRKNQVLAVPIVQELTRGGVAISRWNLRGERLQILVESTGDLGVGELMITGCQVEYNPVRKAAYPGSVDAGAGAQ